MIYSNKWFTLVELIVVVTILAVLSTIGFVAYSGYLSWVRDTNRISQVKSMHDGLMLLQTKSTLPLPDDYVEIQLWGELVSYQWYAGKNIIESIEYTSEWFDPKDQQYFTYTLTADRKYFSLLALLENDLDETLNPVGFSQASHAANYSLRTPYVEWKKVGIYLDENNTPVQENSTVQNDGILDIQNLWSLEYKVYLDSKEFYSGTSAQLIHSLPNYDCKRIKDLKWSSQSGIYSIDPDGDGVTNKVYCDMITDGWGWTFATMLADTTTKNLFSETNSANTEFITSIKSDIYTKWKLSNVWVDDRNRDLLLQCFSSQPEHKKYETPVIVYDFLWTEKSNLTKSIKQNTQFSSNNLTVKWKNRTYIADNLYEDASADETMIITTKDDMDDIFYIQDDRLAAYEYAEPTAPAYSDPSSYKSFSDQVYCVSAIR